jgi:type I restriction enzyme S subunit
MSEWKEYSIEDFAEILNHRRIPLSSMQRAKKKGAFPYYGASGIIDYVDDYIFEGDHVLISEDGENLKSRNTPIAFVARGQFWVNNHAHIVKGKKDFHNKLIVYYMQNLDLNPFLTGAVQPKLNKAALTSIPFFLPSDENEQTAIASVLSSLDDKIDLLHRQNATLEKMAETLFRQWFVEEAKEEWELDTLGKLFDIGIGRTPPRKEHQWFSENPLDMKWVSIKDMGNSGVYISSVSEYLTEEAVERFNIPIIPANTVMLSFKMTIGRLAITTESMLSNEAIAHFKVKKNSKLYSEFLYLYLKTYQWEQLGSTSSIVEAINSQMIKEMEIIIPEEDLLIGFKEIIEPYFQKIKSNQTQIRTLTALRDILLPKLMSGEVKVEMEQEVQKI